VKIYLLSIDKHRFFFYSDVSEAPDDEVDGPGSAGPGQSRLRRWLHDRLHRFQSAWQHAESGVLLWSRRAWDWLHSWARPDEAMLVRLWRARGIDLHHPASRTGEEVGALWAEYLAHRWWRHLLYLSANAVVAPFTVLFAILPGPNVIGYWFAYRAIHHLLIVWGIRRVRRKKIRIEMHPMTSLDRPIEVDEVGRAKHVALDGAAAQLDEHVAWSESESPVTAGVPGEGRPPSAAKQSPTASDSNGLETSDHAAS
jgi:Mitochondrial K+-H+ exchange-related